MAQITKMQTCTNLFNIMFVMTKGAVKTSTTQPSLQSMTSSSSISPKVKHISTLFSVSVSPETRSRPSVPMCMYGGSVEKNGSCAESSRYARVMTTRVNGCLAAVFDRAWIILTTGVRGFMKVPRWPYCKYLWVVENHFKLPNDHPVVMLVLLSESVLLGYCIAAE